MARKKISLCKSVDELMNTYFPKLTAEEKERATLAREAQATLINASGQGKANIHLRARKSTNSLILFLDQTKDGKRIKETLNGYSLKIEENEQIRQDNLKSLEIAKKILNEKKNAILLTGVGIVKTTKCKATLIEYIDELAEEQLKKTGNKHSYYYILKALAKHIVIYSGEKTTLKEINVEYCKGFINYLKVEALNFNFKRTGDVERDENKTLTPNHQHHLLAKFSYVLNNAVEKGLIGSNPLTLKELKAMKPKAETGTRNFLEVEEIKLLYKAECKQPQVKQAFLFCCLTGLRFSDVKTLQWKHLVTDFRGEMFINKNMVKLTKEYEGKASKKSLLNVPVSGEAQRWLPTRGNDDEYVFGELSDNETTNDQLQRWIKGVGITKKITFHCSRHTTATLNLSLGVPIEQVSKLLGHTKISTTQIYADIMQDTLKNSVSKQNGLFD